MKRIQLALVAVWIIVSVSLFGCGDNKGSSLAVALPAAGDLVASSTAQASGIVGAASIVKLRYRMQAIGGGLTEANALLFAPPGSPPNGGWPLVVWAHGTTGVADSCAPSRNFAGLTEPAVANALLAAGFAVLAPDYEGLDAPGVHPYFIRSSHSNSVLSAVKAAQAVGSTTVSKAWSIIGHSQGGHVALSAAQFASQLGTDFPLRGVVALAPGSDLVLSSNLAFQSIDALISAGDLNQAAEILFFVQLNGSFAIHGMRTVNPNLDVSRVFGTRMRPLFDIALTDANCEAFGTAISNDLNAFLSGGGNLGSYPGFRRDWVTNNDFASIATANRVGQVRLTAPVLVVQGSADEQVPAGATTVLAQTLIANGTAVSLLDVPGGTHNSIVIDTLPRAVAFLKANR